MLRRFVGRKELALLIKGDYLVRAAVKAYRINSGMNSDRAKQRSTAIIAKPVVWKDGQLARQADLFGI